MLLLWQMLLISFAILPAERDDIARTNWLHEVISHYSAEQIVVSPSCHHPASRYL